MWFGGKFANIKAIALEFQDFVLPMKIVKADINSLRIPFTDGGTGHGLMPSVWNALDIISTHVLIRQSTVSGKMSEPIIRCLVNGSLLISNERTSSR